MEHSSAGVMLEEVELETERVWNFVIEREIEAPDRFRAIQSYRYAAYLLGILPRMRMSWARQSAQRSDIGRAINSNLGLLAVYQDLDSKFFLPTLSPREAIR